ncbi:hypothetical protein RHOSPDRAFT_30723 [Rhodotorula sp. JG-1b]|nr:hypothetical protein RHOSPDRAFT_30723 [Rhodotorula sp. JG-1b]
MASSSSSVLGVVAAAAAAAAPSRSEPKPLIRASKEWVVPPRPKPGRKSAKASSETVKPTAKTTQKAFRERRQEYVTELEEKVRRLEAGEGEKCVFYQQQAQRAKSEALAWQQENAKLRQEVEALRAELARQSSPPSLSSGSGGRTSRARPAPAEFAESAAPPPKRRRRAPSNTSSSRATPTFAATDSCSPPLAHPPPTHFSPLSDGLQQPSAPTSPGTVADAEATTSIQIPRCTFCSTGPDCFCAQVGFDIVQTPATSHSGSTTSSSTSAQQAADRATTTTTTTTTADEDPYAAETTYEPAVPLKLRRSGTGSQKSNKPSVWAIEPPAVTGAARLIDAAKAVCSGDPSNCPACSDDPFGKAFCNALSSSVCSTQPCANCPSNRSGRRIPTPPPEKSPPPPPMPIIDEGMALLESLTDLPCCGDPILCGSKTCKTEDQTEPIPPPPLPPLEADAAASAAAAGVETVPCNEAWSALKQHPNIAFADLQMLAEVVAKRTYCKGAVTETPPPPAGVVSETFPATATGRAPLIKFSQAFAAENTRRRLTVERGAVNEALGILDRAVAPPPPGPSPLYRG